MIINTDVETFIWVYVSSSLKFITVHTKPGIRHNTSEVTWWDLNPESWQIMIKDYFSSHVFISKIFVSGFLKTRLHWGFHILNYLVPVSQTHTVSKWFLSDCSCVLLLLLFKNPQPLCLFQPLSAVQTVVAWPSKVRVMLLAALLWSLLLRFPQKRDDGGEKAVRSQKDDIAVAHSQRQQRLLQAWQQPGVWSL